jgi:hypothetical protein
VSGIYGQHRAPFRWRGAARTGGTVGLAVALLLAIGPGEPIAPPPPAAAGEPPAGTVTVHGRAGSFGSLGQSVPSGQSLAQRAVPGWGFPAGVQAGATTVAGDGTVFVAGRDQHGGRGPATGRAVAVGAYQPEAGTYRTIRLRTGAGREEVVDAGGLPLAPSVADLAPIAGGEAVAFTVGPSYQGHDTEADGAWPVLGILTKVDGSWQVAAGEGWANQWSGAELRTSAPPVSERACPELAHAAGHSDCGGLGELVSLPGGALIVAQSGVSGWYNGALLAVRLTGPDRAGRFTAMVTGRYQYPEVRDPETGDTLDLALRDLHADPTGELGDERFVVGLQDLGDEEGRRPLAIQEFRYDAETGEIAPVSAPTIPGDQAGSGAFYGFSATIYDRAGNLWAARHNWLAGGKLAVYRTAGGQRKLGGPECPYDPTAPVSSYLTSAGDRTVWGSPCRPDYDLLQPQDLLAITALAHDPGSGDLVGLSLLGTLLPVRVSGEAQLSFQVGNLVDTALRLLQPPAGSLPEHPPGAFDADGRLWLAAAQAQPRGESAVVDQWLYEVDVGALFDPLPVALPDVPGQVATVQAGHTATTATAQIDGSWAAADVNSMAYVRVCGDATAGVDCSYDGVPGNGFVLSHRTGLGHLGNEVAYRVDVPVAGRYRVAYRVLTFEVVTGAEITLSAGGRGYATAIDTEGRWRTVPQPDVVDLPAGVSTIRLSAVDGRGGWHLSWFSLQRT